jgi:hypothetical protein
MHLENPAWPRGPVSIVVPYLTCARQAVSSASSNSKEVSVARTADSQSDSPHTADGGLPSGSWVMEGGTLALLGVRAGPSIRVVCLPLGLPRPRPGPPSASPSRKKAGSPLGRET